VFNRKRCVRRDTHPTSRRSVSSWCLARVGRSGEGGRSCEKDLETKRPRKPARPAAEVAAYGVLEGGRAISGVSTCVSVAFLFTLLFQASL
jgi:hypothetical protein